uniref:Putative kunitz n=1 Tax=Rhipicephalus microplus TaxID=6941 RepID=A0A6G5A1V2_RHIMP
MSVTFLLLWGCIMSALLRTSQGCKKCCASCTRPRPPACQPSPTAKGKALFFPDQQKKPVPELLRSAAKENSTQTKMSATGAAHHTSNKDT